jgi:hypothetical protein
MAALLKSIPRDGSGPFLDEKRFRWDLRSLEGKGAGGRWGCILRDGRLQRWSAGKKEDLS